MNNYQQAKTLLDLRNRQGHDRAKLSNNVYLESRGNDCIAVKYYDTDIVVYHPNGKIELRNGGWQTATTKQNLNMYSPFTVYQEKGVWFINLGPDFHVPKIKKFTDGMILDTPEWALVA